MKENKQKVGTMTFHMAHNYGAMLQAYALPVAVRKLGYDCEVIDYRFPYIDQWSRIEHMSDLVAKYGKIGGVLRFIKRFLTGYYNTKNLHVKFDAFERDIMLHSKNTYRDKSELHDLDYDVILFGSDQIWNVELTNGIAEEYIGGFDCLPHTRKVAYAASCGLSDFPQECRKVYSHYLESFSAIGIREKEFQNSLCERGYQAEWVLDPTMLLTAEDWKCILPRKYRPIKEKYLLVYAFDVEDSLYDRAKAYATEKGLEIVAIAYKKIAAMEGMNVFLDCGPLEFLSLFLYAEHILAGSFHGTVFSIIFHREFHCIPHPKYRDRTDSLLEMLELTDHCVEQEEQFADRKTDWDRVDTILSENRDKSYTFLKTAIEGARSDCTDE